MNSSISNSKAFVKAYLLTLVAGLGFSIALTEYQLRRNVLPYDPFTNYKQLFLTSTAPIAAFGDSHVASGVISQQDFDNFGQASDNLETIQTKLEHRVARGSLDGVILQADAQIFAPYRINAKQDLRIQALFDPRDPVLVMLRPEYRQFLMQYWWVTIKDPMSLFRERKQEVENPVEISFDKIPNGERERNSMFRTQLHSPINNVATSSTARIYSQLIETLLKADLEICLVTFPLSSDYRKAASNHSTFHAVYDFYKTLAKHHNVVYINAFDSFPDSSFGDPDHLLPSAAKTFTAKLLRDCFPNKR